MLVAEKFIRLVEKYGKNTVYVDDGKWYYILSNVIGFEYYLNSHL